MEVGARFVCSDGEGPRSTPTMDGDFLYTIGGHGDLVCVETASGRKVWSQGLETSLGGVKEQYGYAESPLVDGDQVVATPGGKKGTISAFDKKTGILKWSCTTRTTNTRYSSMIAIEVGGVRQYVQMLEGSLVGVRASDGKLLWEFPFSATFTPIYQNDCVYVSSGGDGCLLLKLMADGDKFKAEPIYVNGVTHIGYPGAILVEECLYGYSADGGGWTCQNFKTGMKVWNKDLNMGKGSVTFADGNLYCYYLGM